MNFSYLINVKRKAETVSVFSYLKCKILSPAGSSFFFLFLIKCTGCSIIIAKDFKGYSIEEIGNLFETNYHFNLNVQLKIRKKPQIFKTTIK